MSELTCFDGETRPVFVDYVAEKAVVGGMIRVGLACLINERGNAVMSQRMVMRLKTAVELRNALNEMIDDQSAGIVDR